jgi:hypothetical protein
MELTRKVGEIVGKTYEQESAYGFAKYVKRRLIYEVAAQELCLFTAIAFAP